ncbi:hypothetical protein Nepgr_025695 [Nepenthes gracilis]|uniref:Methyltransferase type 11 domain-containing protein n=1 Tax=Nepenthes gracilis TaxID=150966 RepID=A0AAD3T897_NEPGR|nr:hypothetical protein Nepgr_025695 [Nepenthes gracilis]
MGSGAEDYQRKQAHQQQRQCQCKLNIVLLVLLTNLLTVFFLTSTNLSYYTQHFNLGLGEESATLIRELNATRDRLTASESQASGLYEKLTSTNLLVQSLLIELARLGELSDSNKFGKLENFNHALAGEVSRELGLAIGPQKLPLGYSPKTGTDEVYPAFGAGCLPYKDELAQYMSYKVGGECPVDDVFAQRLMLKGCEPLPRRRCHPKSPAGYVEPNPFPQSLWATPPDTSIIWDPYTCKNYQCLVDREKAPGIYDCKDCFNLQGRERHRWLFDNEGLQYGIDQVLGMKPPGTIRIGFDIGGGVGTFAARMRERNITIVTSTMNLDGPFNSFIASRGLVPLHLSVSQRLPFFENTLDIVHSMHVLSNWIPNAMLEFILYDIYRVLRPGGLFWLDHFFCQETQLNQTYVPMINRIGFNKLRWNVGKKVDRGQDKKEWYVSALFEKPTN